MKKITEFQIKISPQNVCAMLDADRSSLEEEMREELEEMLPEAYERLEPAAFLGFGDTEGFLLQVCECITVLAVLLGQRVWGGV